MSQIKITDTSLRDGHQSLWATRMTTEDMLPILEKLDQAGYYSLEVWGGATFDVCIRFLNENPWERLRTIRKHVKNTKLQMLIRGQSLVGYNHYPDDIVEKFVEKAAENGIDIFRAFDALNDLRNLETCMRAIKKADKHAQGCVVYTISPVHSMQHFVDTALRLQDMGADSICIKDMAGLLSPYVSYELVKALKSNVDIPIQLHTHYIGGLAMASLLKAVEAGVDVVDTASVPMAFGSSQPPVETLVRALQDSEWDTGMKLHDLFEIADYFEKVRKERGYERGVTRINDMKVFEHQVPGGMISNLYSQLEEQKATHRMDEVLKEIPLVRADMGYPPLVTPTSQIIGIQAVLNVLTGERYKICPGEVKDYVKGLYGKPPEVITDEIREKIIDNEEVITVRPADLLEPYWEKAKAEVADLVEKEEDVLTYALFPQIALKYFDKRKKPDNETITVKTPKSTEQEEADKKKSGTKNATNKTKTNIAGKGDEEMNVNEIKELIKTLDQSNLTEIQIQKGDYKVSLSKAGVEKKSSFSAEAVDSAIVEEVVEDTEVTETKTTLNSKNIEEILAPMTGTFYSAPSPDSDPYVQLGDFVEEGQTLCLFEAMKLINEIDAECDGTIVEILAENGQQVEQGEVLFRIEKQ